MSARIEQTLNAQLVILLLSSCGCIHFATSSSITAPTFEEYVERFGKVYDGSEYSDRKELYEKRLAEILDHNAQDNRTWNASVTSRTDAKPKVTKPRVRRHADGDLVSDMSYDAERSLPWSVDWRTRQPPVLTELFDQNPCGDCWAIHSVKALESHLAIATGELLQLSSQQAADCSSHGNSRHDCNYGGYPEDVYTHAAKHGIPLRQDYPRLGHGASCNLHVKAAAGARGSVKPQSNDAHALMSAVAHHGPVSVGVDSSKWDNYAGGIFDGSRKDTSSLDHEVLLVGYGEEAGRKYWAVQNSWGANWGERGFIRLRRYDSEPCAKDTYDRQYKNCGESGILADTTYPEGVFRRHHRRLTADDSPPIEASGVYTARGCASLITLLGLVLVFSSLWSA